MVQNEEDQQHLPEYQQFPGDDDDENDDGFLFFSKRRRWNKLLRSGKHVSASPKAATFFSLRTCAGDSWPCTAKLGVSLVHVGQS